MSTKDTGWGSAGVGLEVDSAMMLRGPIHLRAATSACPSCAELTRVHALIATDVVDLGESGERASYVYGVNGPPAALVEAIATLAPQFQLVLTGDEARLANLCEHCGSVQEDVELHEAPDGPFVGRPPAGHFGPVVLHEDLEVQEARYSTC